MCGRYRLSRRKQILEEHFDSVSGTEDWYPRSNIAPTQLVPIIRQNPKQPVRELSLFRWGLVPRWAKDPSVAAKMINARSETASTKPAFSDALKFRRCLVLADGFYEWQKTGKVKQPYCFEINDGELFARTRHLRNFNASEKAGFVLAVSDLALIIFAATDGSFAHLGTSPHRKSDNSRTGCFGFWRMIGTS